MKHPFLLLFLLAAPTLCYGLSTSAHTTDSTDIYENADFLAPLKSGGQQIDAITIQSPDNSLALSVTIYSNKVNYTLSKQGAAVLLPSDLGLQLTDGDLMQEISLTEITTSEKQETISLSFGERPNFASHYKEIRLHLKNKNSLHFQLIFRLSNQGMAFRYHFPETNSRKQLRVQYEHSNFVLADSYTAWGEKYNEQGYSPSAVNNLRSLVPLTLSGSNYSLCINEADNDRFARMGLSGINNSLKTTFLGSTSQHALPLSLPWRYVTVGDSPEDLIDKKEMLYALTAEAFDPKDWHWVKPGNVFRCLNLTTAAALEALDFCADMNIPYMMFDAGWYGLGYGQSKEKNPASNPLEVIAALDMKKITAYAHNKGIGILLYVNKVAWDNYDNQAMFDLYESWGIKGLKLGFVDGYTAAGNQQVYRIIKEAARRKMLVNVHDNFRPTGLVHRYPNLMTAEGVRGNEYIGNTGDHTVLIPYTRMLTGATDFTICYLGNDPSYEKPAYLNTTRAHQLAMSIIMYSPLQHIFWYAKPGIYHHPVEVELFTYLPVVWDDFVIVKGEMGQYIGMARKKGNRWFLALLNNSKARNIEVDLDFLNAQKNYQMAIYQDDNKGSVQKSISQIPDNKKLSVSLKSNGGSVVVLYEDTDTLMVDIPEATFTRLAPNPAEDICYLTVATPGRNDIRIWDLNGRKMLEVSPLLTKEPYPLEIGQLAPGTYLVIVTDPHQKKTVLPLVVK